MASDAIPTEGSCQWRDIVQANLGRTERLKRNVLDISLEKRTIFDAVGDFEISGLFTQLGIRKEHVEGVQSVPPKSLRKIFVWMVPEVNINQFCFTESFLLNKKVETAIIKPMDQQEVEVIISGLNMNK